MLVFYVMLVLILSGHYSLPEASLAVISEFEHSTYHIGDRETVSAGNVKVEAL